MYKDSNLLSVPSDPVKPSALQTGEQHLIENQLKELVYLLYICLTKKRNSDSTNLIPFLHFNY